MTEEFVTKDECYKINEDIKSDISQIKTALVGEDLRSGLVKDVTEIRMTLKNSHLHSQGNNNEGFGRRERAIVYSSAIASSGLVIAEVLKFIVTRSV